jgi:LmbE family N-acetylglucosaminyl deacetylase
MFFDCATEILLVSPHPDDIALSLGGVLGYSLDPKQCHLVTVFSDTDWLNPSVEQHRSFATQVRQFEDLAFSESLGMRRTAFELRDFPLRTGHSPVDAFSALIDEGLVEIVRGSLERLVKGATAVLAPLGVGSHVDHLVCKVAADALISDPRCSLWHYADMPYALRTNGSADSEDIDASVAWLSGSESLWVEAVSHYPSQLRFADECRRLAEGGPPLSGAKIVEKRGM